MKHLNLNEQGEAIKQFFLSLPVDPEGTMVELNGHPVARLVPMVAGKNRKPTKAWSKELNDRRYFLIDREIEGTLTSEESQELEILQQLMSEHLHRVAPLPLEGTRKLYDELLAKAEATRNG